MSSNTPDARHPSMIVMMCRPVALRRRVAAASVLALFSAGAHAQGLAADEGVERAVSVVPRISLTETLTDNVRLTQSGEQSDQITEISPGVEINMNGARLKAHLDYALKGIFHAQNSSPSRTEQALNTVGTLEAVEDWAFLDFSGSISQEQVSAFGTQSVDNTSINANRVEVSSFRISPYVRGRLGNLANYEARYSRSETDSDTASTLGVSTVEGTAKIAGSTVFRNLDWLADASRQKSDFSAGRPIDADRLNLGLSYAITPQLSISAQAGREAHNYTSLDKQRHGTHGFGVDWLPSESTRFSASRDRRSFAALHNVSFEHRTPRTVWRLNDSRDISNTPNQLAPGSPGTVFDLLFRQFASLEPDEAARAQVVNAFLRANGISPNVLVVNSFLISAASLQRRQDLSFALLGVRDTITFMTTRSESTRLDTVSPAIDDLSASARIRQRGFSINYAHRLTPNYSLGVLLSQQNTTGELPSQVTRLRFLHASLSGKVGKQATVSFGVRRVVSRGNSPYVENAITGNLIVRF